MPLSWNEIKDRALRFSREWADEASEDAEAQSFWNGFFDVFGVPRRKVANFEKKVKKIDGRDGYIDLLWKQVLLVEHKSRGHDLDRAHAQARDYFHGLTDAELPRYLLVSDFARFRLYDLEGDGEPVEFALKDLHKHVRAFGFIAGYQARSFKDEDPVNIEAAERMGRLHDALKAAGYAGHGLEVLLVRLLFCLFAEDTGIFPRSAFHELISQRTREDGSDLGPWLAQLFQTLDTPRDKRQRTLDEQLAELPYVNGKLFSEQLPLAAFDAKMRALLLDASALDWSRISPAIFGSMFQSVMDAKARRNLGAHYTSEKNILKLIGPLFLDELKAELDKIGNHDAKLKSFHVKLSNLRFLDPACGCGNFLVIAYREIRMLELEVLHRQFAQQQSVLTRVAEHVAVDVDQFYGIEIEEFPAQIAQVALWLMDHQMNLQVAEQFGEYFARLPLVKAPTIVNGNALRIDWNDVVPRESLSYILGNPPFVGKKEQSSDQKAELLRIFSNAKGAGVLDYVACWYLLAAKYIVGTNIQCAFVSTNSITQGEQVGVLWSEMFALGVYIGFAHRTFKWTNEARGRAAVHVVIVGFSCVGRSVKSLFSYADPKAEPEFHQAGEINAYLVDAPNVLLPNRSRAICDVPKLIEGITPLDNGHLVLDGEEVAELIRREPEAARWLKRWYSGHSFINDTKLFCLWLSDIDPASLRRLPAVLERVERVREFRLNSRSSQAFASRPWQFRETTISSEFLLIPKSSSENRPFVPMGIVRDAVASNACLMLPEADIFQFGIMTSTMHMAWLRNVGGRLKSDYRYSAGIVYNNFPWPELPDDAAPSNIVTPAQAGVHLDSGVKAKMDSGLRRNDEQGNTSAVAENKHRAAIEAAAQGVLDARAEFPGATLADLYDPLSMPPALVKAHQALDRAVDAAYIAAEKAAGRKPPKLASDAERVAFLFERYQALTSLLPAAKPKRTGRRKSVVRAK